MGHVKKGCLHIYCGDGKGKTTASVGLAVRAAGYGLKVLFCQCMKDGSSGEVEMLKKLGIDYCCCTEKFGFFLEYDRGTEGAGRPCLYTFV